MADLVIDEADSRRRIWPVLLLVIGAIGAFAIVAGWMVISEVRSNEIVRERIRESYQARLLVRETFSLLQDAETGQRGYVISGNPDFLAPHRSATAEIPSRTEALRRTFAGETEQLRRLQQLEDLSAAKLAEMNGVIALRDAGDASGAVARVSSGQGKRLMDEIRVVIAAIGNREDARLAALAREDARRAHHLGWIVFGLLGGIVIVAGAAAALVQRYLSRREIYEEEIRCQRRRVEGMREIADAASLATGFDEALARVRQAMAVAFAGSTVAAWTVDRRRADLVGIPIAGGGPELPLAPTDLELTVSEPAGSAQPWRVSVPVRSAGAPVAIMRAEIPAAAAQGAVLLLAAYAQRQLEHAAERQRAYDTLDEAHARQRAIFAGALDGFITVNESGSIESMNPAAERMFAVASADMVRRHVAVLLPMSEEGPPAFSDLRRFLGGKGAIREAVGQRADGTRFPLDLALSEVQLGNRRIFVAAVRDITERKRIERMKSEFVSTVSHELRTPLTSISGSLGLLAGGAAGTLPAPAARLIEIARRNSERLVRLVNDILDIEKIESGNMVFDIRPVPLEPLVKGVIDANRGFAAGFEADMALDAPAEPLTVRADPDRLVQVVTNLVSNALKFSPKGGTVHVGIERAGNFARISVADQGPGIPESFRARIFSKFAQADSSDSREKGGTGLGLSIVREIATRLGGRVGFDSEPGRGATFHVEIPLVDGAEPASAPPAPRNRVLVCSADYALLRDVSAILEGAGLAVEAVPGARDALKAATAGGQAAVLVDVALPNGGAVVLTRALRTRRETRGLPVLLFGAGAGDNPGGAPAVHWFDLPHDTGRLLALVRGSVSGNPGRRARILHVEDDPDVVRLVCDTLDSSADVTAVASVEAARTAIRTDRPDLVILDLALAEGSGLEILPALREGGDIPVVVFSAQDPSLDLQSSVEAFLTKSHASLEQLAETVKAVIAQRTRGEREEVR